MDQRAAARARWLAPLALLLMVAGLWAVAQSVAQAFGYPRVLGQGMARRGGGRLRMTPL